ncbi:MAG: tRNA uridine-5-carboxymethylaminomethyl(34) synthesis GTPase MnmE [Candidatus Eisenbacteria bacterium]|nr:tRNA uridine-5-carboxymethylaminomethyl(34) synthesis GTPase MnmE [Candidatus Eisenbacteria bacterium]
MSLPLDDDIAAIATAPGESGLAVVRVSGRGALAVADRVFRGAVTLAGAPSHTLHHGWAVAPAGGALLDEVVAGVFRAPRSFTREDVVELSCHGGSLPARQVLEALLAAGARLARPGEFTLRAFLGGRLDLAQAEAVADLIHAETRAASELAIAQLRGALSERLRSFASRIADCAAEVEARVDFAEDVGGVEVPAHIVAAASQLARELTGFVGEGAWARAVREGVHVPIVGRPNAGKSTLFNRLLGEERAIVADTPGTTRDRVSESLELGGVRVTLSDTAGLRESGDAVEAEGVARSRGAMDSAALVLWVHDATREPDAEDGAIAAGLRGRRVLLALNKSDLAGPGVAREVAATLRGPLGDAPPAVALSARTGEGVGDLRAALESQLGARARGPLAGAVANARHAEALARACAALERAASAGGRGEPGEFVALELREALAAVEEVTGQRVSDELLDRIFARFCIGK